MKSKKLATALLSLSIAGSTLFAPIAQAAEPTMAVHFIDVGQGLGILVQSGGQNLVYDGGDSSNADLFTNYLQYQNVETIDYMISSHYDADHIGGLVEVLELFDVKTVIGPDYVHDSSLYTTFIDAVSAEGLSMLYPAVGEAFDFGTGEFTILSPDGIYPNGSNENSVAIKLENSENSFIFTGDAEEVTEQDMISTGMDLDCDVLSVGHHGSSSSTTWDFLSATSPEYAVISCESGNQYGHPHAETMQKLQDMGIQVFRSDKQGTVVALSDGTEITWTVEPCNDYSSGNSQEDSYVPEATEAPAQEEVPVQEEQVESMVWLSATGEKYHSIPNCGRMNPDKARQISKSDAEASGYGPCSKCF